VAVHVALNDEIIACGIAPTKPVAQKTATSIATGGPIPRGADAVVMVEHTQPVGEHGIDIRRAASPGNSCLMPAPTSRNARRCCAREH